MIELPQLDDINHHLSDNVWPCQQNVLKLQCHRINKRVTTGWVNRDELR